MKSFRSFCHSEFRKYNGNQLPGIEASLESTSKQVQVEEILQKETNAEALMTQALLSFHISNCKQRLVAGI